jgi:hypothetical protein
MTQDVTDWKFPNEKLFDKYQNPSGEIFNYLNDITPIPPLPDQIIALKAEGISYFDETRSLIPAPLQFAKFPEVSY